jgi:hypothetical protein
MTILDSELTALDGVDKAYHPLYTQKEGKYVLTGVKGYTPEDREKVTGLHNALKAERTNASTAVNALKPWKTLFGDKKPEDIQTQLDRIEELEAASSGKFDEAELEKRALARATAATKPLERKLNEAAEQLKELGEKATKAEQRVAEFEAKERRALLHGAIAKAALDSHAEPWSYGEGGGLLAVCEGVLEVTEEGKIVSKDGCGYPSGLTVAQLLLQIQPKQPGFWPPSKGGGAGNGRGAGGGAGKNPFAKDSFNYTEQARLLQSNPDLAKQYAAAAGVTLRI